MGKYDIYSNLKAPKDLSAYNLFRGVTDFSRLEQFNLYESGYPLLVVVSIPKFLKAMAAQDGADGSIDRLINSYKHIVQNEFKGFSSGLEDMSTETGEINNGFQSVNVITKTNAPSGSTFSMVYNEKSGSVLTKMHELYLRSVKDPNTGYKTYNGIIQKDATGNNIKPEEAGFDKECFSFLYMHTDNTGLLLERAVYIVGAMPTSAQLSIYNGTKGEVQFQEVTCEYTGYPIVGKQVDARAKQILDYLNTTTDRAEALIKNSYNYKYYGLVDSASGLAQTSLSSNTNAKKTTADTTVTDSNFNNFLGTEETNNGYDTTN